MKDIAPMVLALLPLAIVANGIAIAAVKVIWKVSK